MVSLETWDEYVDRVSRARHVLLERYLEVCYYYGGSVAIKLWLPQDLATLFRCKRLVIKTKTKALILQDRVLTYREDEAYERY